MEEGSIGIWKVIAILVVGMLFGSFILETLMAVLGITVVSFGYVIIYGAPLLVVGGVLWLIFHKKD